MKKKSHSAADKKSVRAHVYFTGRVQGVGFRYTTERLALELGLKGWVKNLPDGRVEVICEGRKETVEKLFESLRTSDLGGYIKKIDCRWGSALNELKDFTVEFYS